jgi:hypothetical protein
MQRLSGAPRARSQTSRRSRLLTPCKTPRSNPNTPAKRPPTARPRPRRTPICNSSQAPEGSRTRDIAPDTRRTLASDVSLWRPAARAREHRHLGLPPPSTPLPLARAQPPTSDSAGPATPSPPCPPQRLVAFSHVRKLPLPVRLVVATSLLPVTNLAHALPPACVRSIPGEANGDLPRCRWRKTWSCHPPPSRHAAPQWPRRISGCSCRNTQSSS